MKPHTFRHDYSVILAANIETRVRQALHEDLNSSDQKSDITAQLIPKNTNVSGILICREEGILCGKDWFNEVFRQLDSNIVVDWFVSDGDKLTPNLKLCDVTGPARAILSGERTAMNFLQTLSGTATETSRYVSKIQDTNCRLLDTRKTLPGLRLAQKYAVVTGGGYNHRIGLFDAYLIKENHIIACGSIENAIKQANKLHPEHPVEIEVENLVEFEKALEAGADVIMLDNFSLVEQCEATKINRGKAALEASGNINLDTIGAIAKTGIDYISVGAITKNVTALDLSLRLKTD